MNDCDVHGGELRRSIGTAAAAEDSGEEDQRPDHNKHPEAGAGISDEKTGKGAVELPEITKIVECTRTEVIKHAIDLRLKLGNTTFDIEEIRFDVDWPDMTILDIWNRTLTRGIHLCSDLIVALQSDVMSMPTVCMLTKVNEFTFGKFVSIVHHNFGIQAATDVVLAASVAESFEELLECKKGKGNDNGKDYAEGDGSKAGD